VTNEYKRWWLYILKLEQGKWYVGITSKTPKERFDEHVLGQRAAYWTMKYKPVSIELVEDLGGVSKEHAEKYENKITRQLMKERGINNVRGGDLTEVEPYVRRFGYFWNQDGWELILYLVFTILVLAAFIIDKFFMPIIPGGSR